MKKKKLRNYQLIAEKDSSIPKIIEPVTGKRIASRVNIDRDCFRKTPDERLRLKKEKSLAKQEINLD